MKTLSQINNSQQKGLLLDFNTNQNPTEIVIFDRAIPGSQHLLRGIKPGTQTYSLETQTNAIEKIANILAKHTNIQTLHIISHGSPGTLYLGNTELNNSNIKNWCQQLRQWRTALTNSATIIFYGCNVAATTAGKQFIAQIHQITGAKIAANPHPTGNSKLGGTWDIPQLLPPSDEKPKLALAETTLQTYSGLLGFATFVTFATGYSPVSIGIGDFNGDGLPDLAVANRTSNTASILLNTTPTGATTPTFAAQVPFATGINSNSVSIDDFNGDSLPDVAVANIGEGNVSILLNTTTAGATTPSFATQVTFATEAAPSSIRTGDFNGDGLPDLAVANLTSSNVSILLNETPTGATAPSFATQITFATGNFPSPVRIGDFNGDGLLDLAVVNFYSNISILLNTTTAGATTPSFAAQVTFNTGSPPRSAGIGDFNGDGKPDLVTANPSSSGVSILLNTTPTGDTTPTFATSVAFDTEG